MKSINIFWNEKSDLSEVVGLGFRDIDQSKCDWKQEYLCEFTKPSDSAVAAAYNGDVKSLPEFSSLPKDLPESFMEFVPGIFDFIEAEIKAGNLTSERSEAFSGEVGTVASKEVLVAETAFSGTVRNGILVHHAGKTITSKDCVEDLASEAPIEIGDKLTMNALLK